MSLNVALVINRQSGEGLAFYVESPITSEAQKELDERRCNSDVQFVTVTEGKRAEQYEKATVYNESARDMIRLQAQITFQHCLERQRKLNTQK